MEVSVLNVEGAARDLDTIVSILAGSSRRQGAIQLDKKLYFPVGLQDATPFKIDLLRHVGSGQATICPEDAVYDMPIEPPGGEGKPSSMQLTLRVTGKPLLCGRTRAELKLHAQVGAKALEPTEDLLQGAAAQARRYFDEHNVMRLVRVLLEALIRDLPEDPLDYIAAFMDRLAGGKEPVVEVASEPQVRGSMLEDVARSSNPKWAVAFDAQDAAGTGTLDVDSFCTAIQAVHPYISVAQARALGNGVALGGRGISIAAFCAASEAVAGGEALAAEVAGLDAETFSALGAAPDSADNDDGRARLRNLLTHALEDGRLEASLSNTMHERVRLKAKQALLDAACNGQLASTLSENPRHTMKTNYLVDLPTGSNEVLQIDGAVAEAKSTPQAFKPSEENEAIGKQCLDLEGELLSKMQEHNQDSDLKEAAGVEYVGKLRAMALDTLISASQDGRLENTFVEIQQQREHAASPPSGAKREPGSQPVQQAKARAPESKVPSSEDRLRMMALDTLSTASQDGRLQKTFADIQQQRELSPEPEATGKMQKTLPVEDLRAKALQTLICANDKRELGDTFMAIRQQHTTAGLSASDLQSNVAAPRQAQGAMPMDTAVLCETVACDAEPVDAPQVPSQAIKVSTDAPQEMEQANATKASQPAQPERAVMDPQPTTAVIVPVLLPPPSHSEPLSPRHAELLDRQKALLDQQRAMQSHLMKLKETSKAFVPMPPKAKPTGKRPGAAHASSAKSGEPSASHSGAVTTFRDLREINAKLGAENARLNGELARLLARAAQQPGQDAAAN